MGKTPGMYPTTTLSANFPMITIVSCVTLCQVSFANIDLVLQPRTCVYLFLLSILRAGSKRALTSVTASTYLSFIKAFLGETETSGVIL